MSLPVLRILDNALSAPAHEALLKEMEAQVELSVGASSRLLQSVAGCELMACAEMVTGKQLALLAAVLFAIRPGDKTTPHTDFGEYVVLFFPKDCPSGPLRLLSNDQDVKVIANRVVAFDATILCHQQVVPSVGVRYSLALKFRHP